LAAALLMLTQRSLKRLLVLSSVEDIGFLLLGAASATKIGAEGALIAASTHALAKALLFVCLSAPEAAGELEGNPVALASRYPVSAFGFLFGMLAMLGVPPMLGFIGRWRLYETAMQIHPALAAVFILSSIFALIAYVLALTRTWWGPPRVADPPGAETRQHTREPFLVQSTVVVLFILLLAGGVWPGLLQMLLGGRP
jgi:formate hydrogenlyase subunit 3/multisubunit Na+/H+ antiporter MnhD subunit